jgi:hypothetical protein
MAHGDKRDRIESVGRTIEIAAALVTLILGTVTIVVWVTGHQAVGTALFVVTFLLILALRRRLAGWLGYQRSVHSDSIRPRARLALMDNVYSWRVEQGFDAALTRAGARFRIQLSPRPDLVQAEFRTDTTPRVEAVSVSEAFDRSQGRLLIVGEPGSGKTMLALELLRDLLRRARGDTSSGIPELFSLATWPGASKPLEEWLKDELHTRGFGPGWIDRRMIIPILDGLDEVKSDFRADCLSAINEFRSNYDGVPIVVTSRLGDYETVPEKSRLAFGGAYSTRPLSDEEVANYFSFRAKLDPQWVEAADAIAQHGEADLKRRLRSPLVLSMVAAASADDAPQAVLESFQQLSSERFWAYFVEAMRRQTLDPRHREPDNPDATPVRGKSPIYGASEVRRWLGWLASDAANSSEFRLTRLALPPSRFGPTLLIQRLYIGALSGVLVGGVALVLAQLAGRLPKSAWKSVVYLSIGLCALVVFNVTVPYLKQLLRTVHEGDLPFSVLLCTYWGVAVPVAGFTSGVVYIEITGHFRGILGILLGLTAGAIVGSSLYIVISSFIAPDSLILALILAVPNLLLVGAVAIAVAHWGNQHLANRSILLGLILGLVIVLLYGLTRGFTRVLWYPVLRIRAWSQGLLPVRLRAFLQWSTNHLYLQRAGDAYRWFHPNLATYLARTSGHVAIPRFILVEIEPLLAAFDRSEASRRVVWPLMDDKYEFLLSIDRRYNDPEITRHIQKSYAKFLEAKRTVSDRDAFFSARSEQVAALSKIMDVAPRRRFRGNKSKADWSRNSGS